MKKMMIFLGCIVLVLASIVFMSYGEMKKIAMLKDNLSDLKGNWVGSRTVGPGDARNTDLEILKDSLPIQGKFTFYEVKSPGRSARTEVIDFKKGRINEQGNLLIGGGGTIEIELSLYKDDGKMKLEGNYSWYGERGTISLKKK